MEDYPQQIEHLKDCYNQLSQSILTGCHEKVKLFNTLKDEVSTEMLNTLCNEMVTCVQEHVEGENALMQETLVAIDHDLNTSLSLMEDVSAYRSQFLGLYNSVTTPKLSEGESMQACVGDGITMVAGEKIQTDTQNVVSSINHLRTEHETLFHEIQETLHAMIETAFDQMGKEVNAHNESIGQKVDVIVVECEEELSRSKDILHEIFTIKEKIQMILCREKSAVAE